MMWSLLLAFTAIALPAYAQTQAQIQACGNSIVMTSYPESGTYTYDTSDTAFFSATYTYSVEACTNNNVPLNRLFLTDYYEGSLYQCSLSRFDQTGMLTSTCNLARSMTHRTMAILAQRDGHNDWSFTINLGQRPTLINVENTFIVQGTGPVPSPGINTRRDWKAELRRNFECPVGQAMCPSGFKGRFECLNVSADVTSCGACPGSAAVTDCTTIDGVSDVECRAGACQVLSCDKGWTVSGNRQQCVPDILLSSRTIM